MSAPDGGAPVGGAAGGGVSVGGARAPRVAALAGPPLVAAAGVWLAASLEPLYTYSWSHPSVMLLGQFALLAAALVVAGREPGGVGPASDGAGGEPGVAPRRARSGAGPGARRGPLSAALLAAFWLYTGVTAGPLFMRAAFLLGGVLPAVVAAAAALAFAVWLRGARAGTALTEAPAQQNRAR